jgi:hypothetical protein
MTAGRPPADRMTSGDVSSVVVEEVTRAGRGLLVLVVAVETLALIVSAQLGLARYLDPAARDAVHLVELILVASFALIALAAFAAWRAGRRRLAVRLLRAYAIVITIEIIGDVVLLVLATQGEAPHSLWYLADLASVLTLNIAVFTIWYMILDVTVPNEVFLFPARSGERPERGLVDYLFLAFNTSMTFGPTIETPVDRHAKLVMMLQTVLSVTILVVLAARIVARS